MTVVSGNLVDIHAHTIPSPEKTAQMPGDAVRLEPSGDRWRVFLSDVHVRTVDDTAWDPRARQRQMDLEGVAHQVLSPTPFMYGYHFDPDLGSAVARVTNESIADMVKGNSDRFTGLGTIPLQDPQAAAAELRYAHTELGLRGVEIGTHLPNAELSDPALEPFFSEANRLGSILFIHPWESRQEARVPGEKFWLGYPAATAGAFGALFHAEMIFKYPRIRFILAHGGGCAPWLAGRLRMASQTGLFSELPSQTSPVEMLRQCWVDSLVYERTALAHLVEFIGVSRVLLGTDFPFLARENPPGSTVIEALERGLLDPESAQRILWGNARVLLGHTDDAWV